MICDTIGLTADRYASMYVHGGSEVAEVYGGLNYIDPIFYKSQTMTWSAPLVFDSYPGGLTDYTIFGNSYQDGTPTPDDPVEVVSVGDLVTSGEHAGEYCIPVSTTEDNFFHATISQGDISAYSGLDQPNNALCRSSYIYLDAGVYTLSASSNITYFSLRLYDKNKTFVVTNSVDGNPKTFTMSISGYLRIVFVSRTGGAGSTVIPITPSDITNVRLKMEVASIYLDEPLRKIGDYADEIDFNILTRKIVKVTLGANTGVTYRGNGVFWIGVSVQQGWRNGEKTVLSTHYSGQNNNSQDSSIFNNHIMALNYGYCIRIRDDRFTSASDFKQFLSDQYAAGTPVTIWYVLAEDQVESVTLPQIQTISGANTLSVGTTVQPSRVSITGHIKPVTS